MAALGTKSQTALIIGIIFLAVSGVMYTQQQSRKAWPTTNGHITGLTSRADANGGRVFAGVVSYTVNGHTYSIQDSSSTKWKPHTGGTKQVVYNPSDPNKAYVKMSSVWKWLFVVIFPIFGCLLLIYALLGFAFSRY
jgi:hypothetical protein